MSAELTPPRRHRSLRSCRGDPPPPGEGRQKRGDIQENRICVAKIGAPHGISGEVRLWSFTEDPMAVASYGTLESEDGALHFEIEDLRPAKGFIVARLFGIRDRSAAARLTNLKLYVPRDRLPPTEDADTFYHADLVGLSAVTPEGEELGKISAIYHYGAGDLIEITGSGETLLVPFRQDTVPTIDIAGGKIVVVPLVESE